MELDKERLPRHIAIIMDGNGRWAQARGLPRVLGHRAGMEAVRRTIEACSDLGVNVLTLYAFSWENWQRPAQEIADLMGLLKEYIDREVEALHRNQVRLNVIGRFHELPSAVQTTLRSAMDITRHNTRLLVNLALSYGGRQELVDAVQAIARRAREGELKPEDINESTIEEHLTTVGIPDPDLLIRTSGQMRISNFLLWQISYSELYVADVLWPDFQEDHLTTAVVAYQQRDRRFGRTPVSY
jgi:undecaprenyl diphosphate synthase